MHKKLLVILAVFVLSVGLVSCKENAAEKKIDPKVLAATVDKASNMADTLDKMDLRAFGMAKLGAAMAAADPAGAAKLLDEALAVAKEVRSPANRAALEELKAETAGWSAADLEQIAPALDRIEKATTRVWVIRAVAEGMDGGRAKAVLMEAADEAAKIPDPRYRDLDLRSVSAQLAKFDTQAAVAAAGNIADPRVKAWALTAIGSGAANREEAVRVLSAAGEVAEGITRMEPSSELVTNETKPAIKEKVLAVAKARLAQESAEALANAASAMNAADPEKARAMFAKAVEAASGIEYPYAKAYALSNVAIALAGSDPQAASEIAEKIEQGHEDAKFAAMMKAAEVKAGKGGSADLAELKNLQNIAASIADPYDRAKALTELGLAVVPVNREVAAEIAKEIEYRELRNKVLAAVAVAWARENDDQAKDALAKIEEPRFAKAGVLYAKGEALCEMAAIKAATDTSAAVKLYGKAASFASDAKSTQLQWKVAAALCKLDKGKLFDMAAKIEGDSYNQAKALAEIAADWSAKGDPNAGMVWDMAARAATGMDDDFASSEMLTAVAAKCLQYDRARASAIFAKAAEKAVGIGKPKG